MKKLTHIALAATLALSSLSASAQTLLNASYDVAREFYKDYNAAFVVHYKKTTGKDVKIDQAHGGSSAQARAVNDGLDADVVTMNTTTDVDFLAGTGVVAKDWNKRFAHNASPTTSRHIKSFYLKSTASNCRSLHKSSLYFLTIKIS